MLYRALSSYIGQIWILGLIWDFFIEFCDRAKQFPVEWRPILLILSKIISKIIALPKISTFPFFNTLRVHCKLLWNNNRWRCCIHWVFFIRSLEIGLRLKLLKIFSIPASKLLIFFLKFSRFQPQNSKFFCDFNLQLLKYFFPRGSVFFF